jgi:hypothetical protein
MALADLTGLRPSQEGLAAFWPSTAHGEDLIENETRRELLF